MRRAFSVFRGYRRAGEDDDDVFVCSPGSKVTFAVFSAVSSACTDGFYVPCLPLFCLLRLQVLFISS